MLKIEDKLSSLNKSDHHEILQSLKPAFEEGVHFTSIPRNIFNLGKFNNLDLPPELWVFINWNTDVNNGSRVNSTKEWCKIHDLNIQDQFDYSQVKAQGRLASLEMMELLKILKTVPKEEITLNDLHSLTFNENSITSYKLYKDIGNIVNDVKVSNLLDKYDLEDCVCIIPEGTMNVSEMYFNIESIDGPVKKYSVCENVNFDFNIHDVKVYKLVH